jgi:hypothetical protein
LNWIALGVSNRQVNHPEIVGIAGCPDHAGDAVDGYVEMQSGWCGIAIPQDSPALSRMIITRSARGYLINITAALN